MELLLIYAAYLLFVAVVIGSIIKRVFMSGIPQKPLATVTTLENLRESQATIEKLEASNDSQSH